ncbi:MAG: hypothetical protein HY897_21640 [Deltaproteobacteria bacterium]|nr:hypothetical protein [Deltaproteobacteria bacterium]
MSAPKKKKTAKTLRGSLPKFDPNPSARFASAFLLGEGVPHALIGRIAMWTLLPQDQHEFTKDVDFAVPLRFCEPIRAALARRNIVPRDLPIGGLAVREGEIKVDFIDRREGGLNRLFEEAIEAAGRAGPRTRVAGSKIPVVPPEYLLALKVVAAERKDQDDALRLLRALPGLDLRQARDIVFRHGGPGSANLLDALARQAGRPDARPEYRNGG